MTSYILIIFGSAAGGFGRFWCSSILNRHFSHKFPWGTLAVNTGGCFLLGLVTGLFDSARPDIPREAVLALTVGFCGSFTTVSAFSLETLTLLQRRDWIAAAFNVGTTLLTCLSGISLGLILAVGTTA